MTSSNAAPFHRAIISLWKRAPLWRFSTVFAVFLSLLFVLFPPLHQTNDISMQAIPAQADYTPQPTLPAAASPAPTNTTAINQPKNDDETGVDPTLLGHLYSGSIEIGGFIVPLPEGNWAILANMSLDTPKGSGIGYFLGQVKNKRLIRAATIYGKKAKTALDDLTHEMMLGHGCDFPNAMYTYNDDTTVADHFSCWYTQSLFGAFWQHWNDKTAKMNPLERLAAQNMAAMSITYPQDLGSVVLLQKEKWGVLYATFYFSPEIKGITSNKVAVYGDSDWAPGNIKRFPEKLAYMEKVKAWGNQVWPQIKTAFAEGKPFP